MAASAAHAQFAEADVHDFGAGSDGEFTAAGVFIDASGNLYGTAPEGGLNFGGMVWKLNPSTGTYTDLWDFGAGSDGNFPNAGVSMDAAGNLYGTTEYGGANGKGMVWMLSPSSGTYTDLWDFGAGSDGQYPTAGVSLDAAGNLYGTTSRGGINGNPNGGGIVWELTPSSGTYIETDLHDFGAGSDGSSAWAGVSFDAAGNLYGTTQYGGANGSTFGGGTVWTLNLSTMTYTDLHDFGAGSDGEGVIAGVSFDAAGNLYGTAQEGGANGTGMVWTLNLSTTTYADLWDFGAGSDGQYPSAGVSFDAAGNLYGTTEDGGASGFGMVWELTPSSGTTYIESDLHDFSAGSDGATPASGISFDGNGNLYGTTVSAAAHGKGMVWELVQPGPAAISTSRDPNPALAGGVGVTFAATVTVPAGFPGGTVTLTSGDSSHLLVAAGSDAPSGSDSVTLPAGAGTAQFTISAPSDVATATPVVLTASGSALISATETVTVEPFVQSLTFSAPGTIAGHTLSGYAYVYEAPATNQTLTLNSSAIPDSNCPATVSVLAGQVQSNRITCNVSDVSSTESGAIVASHGASSASTTISIYAPWLTGLSFNPTQVNAGGSSIITATLNAPLPVAQTISATSSNTAIAPSVTIKIPAGQTVGSATVATSNFSSLSDTGVTFTATFGVTSAGVTATHTARLNVEPVQISSITVDDSVIHSGYPGEVIVLLTAPVTSTTQIAVNSSNTSLVPGFTVTAYAGEDFAYGQFSTNFVLGTATPKVTFSAALVSGGVSRSTSFAVLEDQVSATLANSNISELDSTMMTVSLAYAPFARESIPVTSSNTTLVAGGTVSIPAFESVGSLTITPHFTALAAAKSLTLTAGSAKSTLTLNPEVLSVTLNPSTVNGSVGTTATITLFEAYTGSGTGTASSNSSVAFFPVGTNPISLNTGSKTITFPVSTVKRTSQATAYISVSALGYSRQAKLTINAGP